MTRSFRAGLCFLTTAALLAGCTTAPQPETITVPNPLAALNGVLVPAPTPAYRQAAPATYNAYSPGYTVSPPAYGAATPSYDAVNTVSLPAPVVLDSGSYTTGAIQTVGPAYASGVPTFGTLEPQAPVTEPVYAASEPVIAGDTYTAGSMDDPAYAISAPAVGSAQPVRASGTTYDLTINEGFDSAPGMGGSFQVVPPGASSIGDGVATYSPAPTLTY